MPRTPRSGPAHRPPAATATPAALPRTAHPETAPGIATAPGTGPAPGAAGRLRRALTATAPGIAPAPGITPASLIATAPHIAPALLTATPPGIATAPNTAPGAADRLRRALTAAGLTPAPRPRAAPTATPGRGLPALRPAAPAPRPRAARAARTAATACLASVAVLVSLTLGAPPAAADAVRQADWALDALHAERAWRTTQGNGVTVAVLDTGVDATHPDLTGQVLPGKDEIGFGAKRGQRAWARHGTGMAAIIAGHGHGTGGGSGMLGIAPKARVLPVRVILEDKDPQRQKARKSRGGALPAGIRWAVDHGADVINLSLGDDSATAAPVAAEADAVQYALRKGVVVVASAGNGGEQADRSSYPAAYPGVIAVAAVDRNGVHAAFSTRRWYASVSAPGVDVVIADPDRTYYQGWGTSAASAYVSGAAALIRSAYPRLSPAQVKQVLQDTTRHRPRGGRSDSLGTGLIDPAAALAAAGRLRPASAVPVPAAYPHRYFAPGPTPAPASADPDQVLGDGLAAAFAAGGAGLVALAALLWFRPRRRASGYDRAGRPPGAWGG